MRAPADPWGSRRATAEKGVAAEHGGKDRIGNRVGSDTVVFSRSALHESPWLKANRFDRPFLRNVANDRFFRAAAWPPVDRGDVNLALRNFTDPHAHLQRLNLNRRMVCASHKARSVRKA